MVIYSHSKPPKATGQTFTQASLTDQLADEPLKRIFERYIRSGEVLPMVKGDVDANASAAELDAALDDLSDADALTMSRVEQAEALATAQRLLEQLQKPLAVKRKDASKTDAERSGVQAAPNEPLKDSKVDTEPKNG